MFWSRIERVLVDLSEVRATRLQAEFGHANDVEFDARVVRLPIGVIGAAVGGVCVARWCTGSERDSDLAGDVTGSQRLLAASGAGVDRAATVRP